MHYHAWSFAIDSSKYTIVTKDTAMQSVIGQRKGLSPGDVQGINSNFCPSLLALPSMPHRAGCLRGAG